MAERSRASFQTEYQTSSAGAFKDNTTKFITAGTMRTFADDISESHAMFEDLKPITASGTDTYTASSSPTLTSYSNGRLFLVLFTNANTGAATLNVDSLGAKAITKNGTTALGAGDIAAGSVKLLAYDGTRFQVVGAPQSSSNTINTATVDLSSAEILALNSTPKEVVPAPGANKVIQVISAYFKYTYNSIAYATNTNIELIYAGITGDDVVGWTSAINGSTSRYMVQAFSSVNQTTDLSNKALQVQVETGNPTAGNGTGRLVVQYTIIDV